MSIGTEKADKPILDNLFLGVRAGHPHSLFLPRKKNGTKKSSNKAPTPNANLR